MLTTAAVLDRNLDTAISELLANVRKLAIAGFATEAREALGLLLQPGPWRLPAHGTLVQQLQRLLPPVSLLAGQACPAIGEQEAIPVAQQASWAEESAEEHVRMLAMVGRNQQQPAGGDWSPAFLSTLAQRRGDADEPRQHLAFGSFTGDAEFVLKARIGERFGCSTSVVDLPTPEQLKELGLPADALAQLMAQFQGAGRIDIAPAAQATDTLDIARATAGYLRATGFGGGYLASFIFLASWLLLVEEGKDAAALEVATTWLPLEGDAAASMLDYAAVASVTRFLRSGSLAQAVQVDAAAARGWLAALQTRQMAEATAAAAPQPTAPAQTPTAFQAGLQGTALQPLSWLQVPVPGSDEVAWVASIPVARRKELWRAARALVERTGRWPLVTTLWSSSDGPPDAAQLGEDLFMRSPYAHGPARDDISARSFIATSKSIDIDAYLAELAARDEPLEDEDESADQDEVLDPALGRQEEFEPDNAWLVLLPTPNGEDSLAYVHWFGIERGSADGFIALLRRWRETHGAELFAHYGTMLEFVVTQPPVDSAAAMALAREHALAAPCTLMLPGIPLRHYALGLLGHGEWFLHERP